MCVCVFLSDYNRYKSFEVFFVGKHFIRMTEQRVRAKYVYVFENDCAFVITAVGAHFFFCSTVSVNRKYVSNVEKKTEWRNGT